MSTASVASCRPGEAMLRQAGVGSCSSPADVPVETLIYHSVMAGVCIVALGIFCKAVREE